MVQGIPSSISSSSTISSSHTSHHHHSQHHPQHHQYNQHPSLQPLPRPPPAAPPLLGAAGMNLVSPPGAGSIMNSREQQSQQQQSSRGANNPHGMGHPHSGLGPPPPPRGGGYPSIPPPPSPNNGGQGSYHHNLHHGPPPRGHYPQHGHSVGGGQPPPPPPNVHLPPSVSHGPPPPLHSSHVGGPIPGNTGKRDHAGSSRGVGSSQQSSSRPPGHGSSHHGHGMMGSQGPTQDHKDDQVFLHSGLNGDWQSDKDMDHRRQMIQHIVRLLKQRDRNQSQEWLSKLPQMVKQLEVSLYRSAPSFEAYSDISTLKHRLQLLAMEIARKTQQHKQDSNNSNSMEDGRNAHGMGSPGRSSKGGYNNSRRGDSRHPMDRGSGGRHDRKRMDESYNNYDPHRGNDMNSSSSSRPGLDPISSSILECLGDSPDPMNGQPPRPPPPFDPRSSKSDPSRPSPSSDPRIKIKQQRLIMLYHSSKCDAEEGQCKTSIYCAEMKRLWKHMTRCQDNNCNVPHCFSSRTILAHYKKCQDKTCYACAPVREAVKKSAQNKQGRVSGSGGSGDNRMQQQQGRDPSKGGKGYPNSFDNNTQQSNSSNTQPSSFSPEPPPPSSRGGGNSNSPQYSKHHSSSNGVPPSSTSYRNEKTAPPHPSAYDPHRQPPLPHATRRQSYDSKYDRPDPLTDPSDKSQQHPSYPPQGSKFDYQSKMKHKQQRLLLLRHASKCPYEEGACPDVPYCAIMKRLWKHIADCNNQKCEVQHCISSRYILSHYRRCRDANCPACAPVREAIKRSHDKDQGERVPSILDSRGRDRQEQITHGSKEQIPPAPQSQNSWNFRVNSPLLPSTDNVTSNTTALEEKIVASPPSKRIKLNDSDYNNNNALLRESSSSSPMILDGPSASSSSSNIKNPMNTKSSNNSPLAGLHSTPSPDQTTVEKHDSKDDVIKPKLQLKPKSQPKLHPRHSKECRPTELASSSSSQKRMKEDTAATSVAITDSKTKSSSTNLKKEHAADTTTSSSSHTAKPEEDYSIINCFTTDQIESHIQSLNRTFQLPPSKLKAKCLEVIKGLQQHQHGWVFNAPVDPVELALPDYFEIIKRPMDLGTVQRKLESSSYHSIEEFATNVNLTFDNAMTYNQEGSVVHTMAAELKERFSQYHKALIQTLEQEDIERRKSDHACTLCGCVKLLFEPPVYFCNGLNCPSKRIRRNSHYYIGGNNQYYWCNTCFNELDDKAKIEFADATIKKSDMKKKKNDEQPEESWVQCDCCERWIHQICGLFNARQNKEHKSEYICPLCTLDERKKLSLGSGLEAKIETTSASDSTKLSEKNNNKSLSAVDLPRTNLSERLEKGVRKKVEEKMDTLIQEQADSDKITIEEATTLVKSGGSIIIRQVTSTDRKLEVRERMKKRYAHKNYPDEFPFRCKCIVVFQNLDGVDIILFALYLYEHGEDNPIPNKRTVYISYLDSVHFLRPRRLRTFIYHEILISYLDYARKKGFATAHIWACPPLKGDDYIFYCKPEDQKTPKDARLRQWYVDMLLECQKRNIVGRLTNMYDLYFANETLDATAVPYLEGDYFPGEAEHCIKEIEEGGKKDNNGKKKSKKRSNSTTKSNGSTKNKSKAGGSTSRSNSLGEEEEIAMAVSELNSASIQKCYKEGGRDMVMVKLGEIIKPMKESFIVAFLNWSGIKEEDLNAVPEDIKEHRKEYIKSKQNENTLPDHVESSLSCASSCKNNDIKVIDDDLEELDCEFLNNRQAFLNLCRGNHYQFDELRRAKHSSMMVLWHLHNRDAPKFVQQCVACGREILTGTRYHCSTCPDYDLCKECFENPKTNRGTCKHKLDPILVEGESTKESSSSGALTEEQRRERQRNIQLHIQLIEHASKCDSKKCTSSNCAKMKGFLKHGEECKIKATGGCKICKRIWTLLRIHAQHCKNTVCTVPNCMSIRERFRQLAKQQQAMDDRRREEMNRAYRGGGLSENR